MMLLSENNETFVPIQVIPQETTLSKKREIGSANMLLGQLPTLAGAKELSTAYKVVFPAGVCVDGDAQAACVCGYPGRDRCRGDRAAAVGHGEAET